MADEGSNRRLIFISGLSGAGKSVVLHTLEDLGFYCIDNLPISLMDRLTEQIESLPAHIAIGIDSRNLAGELSGFPDVINRLKRRGINCEVIFLDASNEVLTKRFSETRRKHPLSSGQASLDDAIKKDRGILSSLSEIADIRVDTSHTNVHDLRKLIFDRIDPKKPGILSIQLVSFGYKHGTPRDADFIFDVRCLPNPYWEKTLRQFSGKDEAVIEFLDKQPLAGHMIDHIHSFLQEWVPYFEAEQRSYLTIAVGCTGGRHRSVYIIDRLAEKLGPTQRNILVRHRDL